MNTSDDIIARYFNIQIVEEHERVHTHTSTHLSTNQHAHYKPASSKTTTLSV